MKGDHESVASHGSSGIAFTDEESIMLHLDNFCNHVRSMIDIIHTLSQLSKLRNDLRNLPRVGRDVVINGVGSLDEEQTVGDVQLKVAGDAGGHKTMGATSVGSGSDHGYPGRNMNLYIYTYAKFLVKLTTTCTCTLQLHTV